MGEQDRQGRSHFEPPPWELEAFEALAAKRTAQEEEARIAAGLFDEARVAEDVETKADPAGLEAGGAPERVVLAPAPATEPDSRLVEAMMQQLAREEYSDHRSQKIVARVAAGVTVALGASMLISGLSMATRSGGKSAAVIGSAVLVVFGLSFVGMAVWVWVSTSRVRGR
jgi:hypothetical protein